MLVRLPSGRTCFPLWWMRPVVAHKEDRPRTRKEDAIEAIYSSALYCFLGFFFSVSANDMFFLGWWGRVPRNLLTIVTSVKLLTESVSICAKYIKTAASNPGISTSETNHSAAWVGKILEEQSTACIFQKALRIKNRDIDVFGSALDAFPEKILQPNVFSVEVTE